MTENAPVSRDNRDFEEPAQDWVDTVAAHLDSPQYYDLNTDEPIVVAIQGQSDEAFIVADYFLLANGDDFAEVRHFRDSERDDE